MMYVFVCERYCGVGRIFHPFFFIPDNVQCARQGHWSTDHL